MLTDPRNKVHEGKRRAEVGFVYVIVYVDYYVHVSVRSFTFIKCGESHKTPAAGRRDYAPSAQEKGGGLDYESC